MQSSSKPLYHIDECPELMADACVCDLANQLIFASLWGRDTAVQEFLAKLTLGASNHGLDQFHLVNESITLPVYVHKADRLRKHSTRVYQRTLFGSLVNTWLVDERCTDPDKTNATAFAIVPRDSIDRADRLWSLVQKTCPLPLLHHWRDSVVQLLTEESMLATLPFSIGPYEGFQLSINVPVLTEKLGERIRDGRLGVEPQDVLNHTMPLAA